MTDFQVEVTEQIISVDVTEGDQVLVEVDEQIVDVEISAVGLQGPPGSGIIFGTGPPGPGSGTDQDMYIDVSTGDVYGPKQNNLWPTSATYTIAAQVRRHVHIQGSASTTWVIDHPLGGRPSVTVADTSRSVVIGDVSYISDSQVVVTFSAPFAGHAYLT